MNRFESLKTFVSFYVNTTDSGQPVWPSVGGQPVWSSVGGTNLNNEYYGLGSIEFRYPHRRIKEILENPKWPNGIKGFKIALSSDLVIPIFQCRDRL